MKTIPNIPETMIIALKDQSLSGELRTIFLNSIAANNVLLNVETCSTPSSSRNYYKILGVKRSKRNKVGAYAIIREVNKLLKSERRRRR